MPKLQLTATGKEQELILAYLEANASEELAEKINAGTPFEKGGKPLLNKKTLAGFMKYAAEEARKTVEKSSSAACIEDAVVYGWAMHYFEEESIVGTLYQEDGSEYLPEKKKTAKPENKTPSLLTPSPKTEVPQDAQFSLFDGLLDLPAPKEEQEEEEIVMKEKADEIASITEEKQVQEITISDGENAVKVNTDTGECTETSVFVDFWNSVDQKLACRLFDLLDQHLDLV